MDKNVTETTLSTNYGDFLRNAVEKAKDQFSDEEYKTLTADAEKDSGYRKSDRCPCPCGRGCFQCRRTGHCLSPSLRAAI